MGLWHDLLALAHGQPGGTLNRKPWKPVNESSRHPMEWYIVIIEERVRVQHWKESLAQREAKAAQMPT